MRRAVAILYSLDSSNGISFMPFEGQGDPFWVPGKASGSYNAVLTQLHRSLYLANVGADFVFPHVTAADLSRYKLLIVPALYVADDALLKKISDYVYSGGHVLMTFKSGFTNENSADWPCGKCLGALHKVHRLVRVFGFPSSEHNVGVLGVRPES